MILKQTGKYSIWSTSSTECVVPNATAKSGGCGFLISSRAQSNYQNELMNQLLQLKELPLPWTIHGMEPLYFTNAKACDMEGWVHRCRRTLQYNIENGKQQTMHPSFTKLLETGPFFETLGLLSVHLVEDIYFHGLLSSTDTTVSSIKLEYGFLFPRGSRDIGWHKDGPDLCICLMYLPAYGRDHTLIPTRLTMAHVIPSHCLKTEYQVDPKYELPTSQDEIELPPMQFGDMLIINNRDMYHRHPKDSELYGNLLRIAVRKVEKKV